MTTKLRSEVIHTFSDFQTIINSNALNEKLGELSQKDDTVDGSGIMFSPLPGFVFGYCGPLRVEELIQQNLFYDEPVFVILLVLDGSCRYRVQGASSDFTLAKDMLIAGYWDEINSTQIITAQKSYTHIGFMFTRSTLETYFGQNSCQEIRELISAKSHCRHTAMGHASSDSIFRARQLLEDTRSISTTDLLSLRGNALNCFVMLMSNISTFGTDQGAYPPHDEDVQRIGSLKEYIDNNLLDIGRVKDICGQFGMSYSKANTLFKSVYFMTIAQYIHDHKMTYAYSRLVSRKCNVTECATEVGYTNISHFITSFKKRYNLTPKAATRLSSRSAGKAATMGQYPD